MAAVDADAGAPPGDGWAQCAAGWVSQRVGDWMPAQLTPSVKRVEETEFDLWLREVVLVALYLATCLCVAYLLGLMWRKQHTRVAELLSMSATSPPATPLRRHGTALGGRGATLVVDPEVALGPAGAAAFPAVGGVAPADADADADDEATLAVDVSSLPFHICVWSFAMALATALALPLTLITVTVLEVTGSGWVVQHRLVTLLWQLLVKGSNAMLFLGLPFGYFFHEADGVSGGVRGLVRRLVSAFVEVVLLAVVFLGIFTIMQRTLIDPAAFTYPSTIISTAQVTPALCILLFAAPLGVLQLALDSAFNILPHTTASANALHDAVDSHAMETAALTGRLQALQTRMPALTQSPPVSPTLNVGLDTTTAFPPPASGVSAAGGHAHAGDSSAVPSSVNLAVYLQQYGDGTGAASAGSLSSAVGFTTPTRQTRTLSFPPPPDDVVDTFRAADSVVLRRRHLHSAMGAAWDASSTSVRPRRASLPDTFPGGLPAVGAGVPRTAHPSLAAAVLSRHAAPDIADDLRRRIVESERLRLAAVARLKAVPGPTTYLSRLAWLAVFVLTVLLTTVGVLRSVARPLLGLFVSPRRYGIPDCLVDVAITFFFALSSLYGVYTPNTLLPLPLFKWRPKLRSTPLHTLMANAVLLLLLSFSLPIVVRILGIGSGRTLEMIAEHYGYITVLKHPLVTRGYVVALVVVVVWLVAVKARRQFERIRSSLSRTPFWEKQQ